LRLVILISFKRLTAASPSMAAANSLEELASFMEGETVASRNE